MNSRRQMLVLALLAAAVPPAMAAEPKATPPAKAAAEKVDADFLEFLGSLDLEGEEWREYLESRPVQAATGKPVAKAAPPRKAEQAKAKAKEQETQQVKP